MILISEKRLGPDIWSEISDQDEHIEDMMKTIWDREAHCQQNIGATKTYLLSPFNKEIEQVSLLIS